MTLGGVRDIRDGLRWHHLFLSSSMSCLSPLPFPVPPCHACLPAAPISTAEPAPNQSWGEYGENNNVKRRQPHPLVTWKSYFCQEGGRALLTISQPGLGNATPPCRPGPAHFSCETLQVESARPPLFPEHFALAPFFISSVLVE